jgi:ribonuclease M5
MLKLKQAVIVEGKYDKIKLSGILDAVIITTDGFGVFKNREKLELIRLFAKTHGVIILTDSDSAGFLIRNRLKSRINEGEIYNVYIPDVFGKEKRKRIPSKENKIGVEGINADVLREALAKFLQCDTDIPAYMNIQRLYNDGLSGRHNSSQLRRALQKQLNLPEGLTAKALPAVLNALVPEAEYISALERLEKA